MGGTLNEAQHFANPVAQLCHTAGIGGGQAVEIGLAGAALFQPFDLRGFQRAAAAHRQDFAQQFERRHHANIHVVEVDVLADRRLVRRKVGRTAIETGRLQRLGKGDHHRAGESKGGEGGCDKAGSRHGRSPFLMTGQRLPRGERSGLRLL